MNKLPAEFKEHHWRDESSAGHMPGALDSLTTSKRILWGPDKKLQGKLPIASSLPLLDRIFVESCPS